MDNFSPAASWLVKVSSDVGSAEVLLREGYIENSCFHAQQACEKTLKAYLSLHEDEPEWTHDLRKLCKTCMRYDAEFEAVLDDASELTQFISRTRYPGDDSYSEWDAQEALEIVRQIYEFTLPRIQALEQALEEEQGQGDPAMRMQ